MSSAATTALDDAAGPAPLEPLAPLPEARAGSPPRAGSAAAALASQRSPVRGGGRDADRGAVVASTKTLEERAWIDLSLSVYVFARDATTLEVSADPPECAKTDTTRLTNATPQHNPRKPQCPLKKKRTLT